MIRLRGMTWKHDRGLAPMSATAKEFAASHPGVAIEWEARSLSEFGEAPIAGLAGQYDLVVLDHPYMGDLARSRAFLPLDEQLSPGQLQRFAADSVGPSYASYSMEDHQWALAIDASAQVAGYRPDLLERGGVKVPVTWDDVFAMAAIRPGFVSLPLFPLDALLAFFSLCANAGDPPFQTGESVVARDTGELALEKLRRLKSSSVAEATLQNPIAVWEEMSRTDRIAYCPLAFGYSNYARPGYRGRRLAFAPMPSAGHGPVGATLGGAGLAISANCLHREIALEYATLVAGADCQSNLYVESGGQPASRAAWTSDNANVLTGGYFVTLLPTLDHAWLRPRHAGFGPYQNLAAEVISRFLNGKATAREALAELDRVPRHRPAKQ
ncbi:MAG: extracellular solute-binding protein [Acidobacteriaceae bacterium]